MNREPALIVCIIPQGVGVIHTYSVWCLPSMLIWQVWNSELFQKIESHNLLFLQLKNEDITRLWVRISVIATIYQLRNEVKIIFLFDLFIKPYHTLKISCICWNIIIDNVLDRTRIEPTTAIFFCVLSCSQSTFYTPE